MNHEHRASSPLSTAPWMSLVLCLLGTVAIARESTEGDAQQEARRWIAAKFLGQEAWRPNQPGLAVLSNHGPVQKNGRGNEQLQIAGVAFQRGLYCHAQSRIVVRLPAPGRTFCARVGVDSNSQTRPSRGSVVFSVSVPDKQAYRSATLHESMDASPVTVDLAGATEFVLEVEDAGDGIACDQADWADARISLVDGHSVWLDELPMVQLQLGPVPSTAPFSFIYGDRPSSELLPQWTVKRESRRLDAQRTEHTLTYEDPDTGLVASCIAVEYHDFPTVEWTLYLENRGTTDTPILSDIQSLDIQLRRGPGSEYVLYHQLGDSCTADSYEPQTTDLSPNCAGPFRTCWRSADQQPMAVLQHSLGPQWADCRGRMAGPVGGEL